MPSEPSGEFWRVFRYGHFELFLKRDGPARRGLLKRALLTLAFLQPETLYRLRPDSESDTVSGRG